MGRLRSCILLAAVLGWGAARAVEAPAEPEAYRMKDYGAPTPATLRGAEVVTTAQAERLWRDHAAVFVDVFPQPPRPATLAPDVVWREKPRDDIPGSLWLADVGYGALPPATETYFEAGLSRAAGGDKSKPLVIYCKRDCWMSWNAAKRAAALGYAKVEWFPDGVNGWSEAGLPLESRVPEPRSGS